MDLCNKLCSAGRLSYFANTGHFMQSFQPRLFISAMVIGIINFHHFIPLSLTKSVQSKSPWLHFLTHFSADQDEIWYGDQAKIQDQHHDTTFEWDLIKQGKNFGAGLLSYIWESIWFELSMMIDAIELYMLILAWLIQCHSSARKQKLQCQLSHKVFSQFGWNVVYCQNLLVWWTLPHFISSILIYLIHSVFKGENPTYVIFLNKKK